MVNGKEEEKLEAARGQAVRARIINASAGDMQGTPLRIVPLGAPFQVVALDGHDIHKPQTLSSEVLSIGQGQRYDLVFTVPSSGIVEVVNAFSGQVTSIGQGNLSIPKNLNDLPIFDLTSSGVPVLSVICIEANAWRQCIR